MPTEKFCVSSETEMPAGLLGCLHVCTMYIHTLRVLVNVLDVHTHVCTRWRSMNAAVCKPLWHLQNGHGKTEDSGQGPRWRERLAKWIGERDGGALHHRRGGRKGSCGRACREAPLLVSGLAGRSPNRSTAVAPPCILLS